MTRQPTFVPDEGIATVDREHLGVLLAALDNPPETTPTVEALTRAGLLHHGQVDPRVRPVVEALDQPGGWLLLQARSRARVTRTTFAPRPAGTAVVTSLVGHDLLHLGWLEAGMLGRHLARRVGLGPHVAAEPRRPFPVEIATWAEVRAAFDSDRPRGWADGHDVAELHELRWKAAAAAEERTVQVSARLDDVVVDIEPAARFRIDLVDSRGMWLRLCRMTHRFSSGASAAA